MGQLFNGSSDYDDIDSVISDLAATTKGTWSIWVKPVDATPIAPGRRIISFGDENANTVLEFRIQPVTGLLYALCVAAGTPKWILQTDSAELSDGVLAYVALTQDGVEPILYVNGSAPAQTFLDSSDKTAWFNDLAGIDKGRIGCFNFNSLGNGGFWDGQLTEVTFRDNNLSADEIAQEYNSKIKGLALQNQPASLVSHFPMLDGPDGSSSNGDNIKDVFGGNDSTGVGGIWKAEEVLSRSSDVIAVVSPAEVVVGAIMNQFQGPNLGADLFNGALM